MSKLVVGRRRPAAEALLWYVIYQRGAQVVEAFVLSYGPLDCVEVRRVLGLDARTPLAIELAGRQ